jgi:hypothetical protein
MSDSPTDPSPKRVSTDREELARKLRLCFWTVAGWFTWLWKDDIEEDYQKDPEYRAALEYYQQLQTQDEVHYEIAVAYARELYDRYDKTDKTLDEKADSIIKYLGGGSALVTFGALLSVKTDTRSACILGIFGLASLIPSMIAAIFAVVNAVRVRRPRAAGFFPHVRFAVEMSEHHKEEKKISVNVWLLFGPACEAAHFRARYKAKLVARAHKCYQWAIILLLVPITAVIVALLLMMPK